MTPKSGTIPRIASTIGDHFLILLALSFMVGTLVTVLDYQTIGTVNQAEDLPQILRMIDKNYLVRDHFVNSSTSNFSIRFYYNSIMAVLISLLGLPTALFVTCLTINIATVFCTAWFAYRLFQDHLEAGIIASLMMMRTPFVVAGAYGLLANQMLANFACMVFIYVAFFQVIIHRRLVLGALFLGIASLLQPLSAMIAFAICITGTVFADFFYNPSDWYRTIRDWQLWKKYLLSLLVFGGILALIIVPYLMVSAGELSNREFVEIYGYFRVPHHAIPSNFLSWRELIKIALFFLIIATSLLISSQMVNSRRTRLFATGTAITILLLGLGNYLFVEIIPTRIFATLVPIMKSSTIVAWFGTIFIAGVISQPQMKIKRVGVILLIVGYYLLVERAEIIAAAVIAIVIANSVVASGILPFGKAISPRLKSWLYLGAAASVICLIVASTLVSISTTGIYVRDGRQIIPRLTYSITGQAIQYQELYSFAKLNTAEDALFVTPPDLVDFRIFASRALVAAVKTYPANDQGLYEWFQRISDLSNCYEGLPHDPLGSSLTLSTLGARYKQIDDACLTFLREKYAADYALLHLETPTSFPILYCNKHYKLTRLRDDGPSSVAAISDCNPTQ